MKHYIFLIVVLMALMISSDMMFAINHESAHARINEYYGCTDSTIIIAINNMETTCNNHTDVWDYTAMMGAHAQNEINSYPLQIINISIYFAVFMIITAIYIFREKT